MHGGIYHHPYHCNAFIVKLIHKGRECFFQDARVQMNRVFNVQFHWDPCNIAHLAFPAVSKL